MSTVLARIWRPGLLIALTLALAACGGQAATPTPQEAAPTAAPPQATRSAPTAVPTVAPTKAPPTVAPSPVAQAPTGDLWGIVGKSLDATLAAKAMRMKTTITAADGKAIESTIEFVAPDRVHAITAGQEIIAVSGATYMRPEGGQWQKLPVDMSAALLTFRDPAKMEELKKSVKVEQVKFLRADVLNGKPMWVFQYTAKTDFGGVQADAATTMWVGVNDNLPYKSESESTTSATQGKTRSVTVYEYDPALKIEPPM